MTTMSRRCVVAVTALAACTASEPTRPAPAGATLAVHAGDAQTVPAGSTVTLQVMVRDAAGAPLAGIAVSWAVASGGGAVPAASATGTDGVASAAYAVGGATGARTVTATVNGAAGSPARFATTVVPGSAVRLVRSGGDGQRAAAGQSLPAPLRVTVVDEFGNGVPDHAVSWTVAAGAAALTPLSPVTDANGVAAATVALQPPAGTVTIQASAPPLQGSPVSFTATSTIAVALVAQVPVAANYGLHDQFVRDGLAFLAAWNSGLLIYDVGNGIAGGSPSNPRLVGQVVTSANGVPGGAAVHNAWWYHSPGGDRRYVFVGQEGPGTIGTSSSGDIHVVDVSNMAAPVEVAFYRLAGAGTHNFWVDESAEVLYAAYYNGGVVALDVSGTLSGDLAGRELHRLQPGGSGNTFVWGVMLAGPYLYASDMLSGLWQLAWNAGSSTLSVAGGGNNVPERFGSDLWVANGYAYSGTWGTRFSGGSSSGGNAVKVWRLGAGGAPVPADSIVVPGVGTISDIEVSADGRLLVFSTENGPNAGVWFYSLAGNPSRPALIGRYLVPTGVHTATIADIAGRRYVFVSKNPSGPALLVLDVTGLGP